MHGVTAELVKLLDLDISIQRLDSTHIESNMAKFGRIRLMATAARRFLVQLKRQDEQGYGQTRESVRQRYEATPHAIFGWKKLDDEDVNELRQSVAEDLAYLVETFRQDNLPGLRAAYEIMVKVFEQQCEVVGNAWPSASTPGGEIVCNPSDSEATLDGHKGSGYQERVACPAGLTPVRSFYDRGTEQIEILQLPRFATPVHSGTGAPRVTRAGGRP